MAIHLGGKAYHCSYGANEFSQNAFLDNILGETLIRGHVNASIVRIFFINKNNYNSFPSKHISDRPYHCIHCDKAFYKENILINYLVLYN